jgi:CRP-like cAMP-binding protein
LFFRSGERRGLAGSWAGFALLPSQLTGDADGERRPAGLSRVEPRYVEFVLYGSVGISMHGRPIEAIQTGQIVGLLSSVDEQRRTASARTHEPCAVAPFDRKQLRCMIEAIPNFVWFVLAELGARLRAANAAF